MNSFTHTHEGIKLEVMYDNDFECQAIHLKADTSNTDIYELLDPIILGRINDKLLEMYTDSQVESGKSWNGLEWE
jgi:hypothetical protein